MQLTAFLGFALGGFAVEGAGAIAFIGIAMPSGTFSCERGLLTTGDDVARG